ncbi:MAG: methylated-DNA--[protein]-cysteine S-methyltransferase [Clostridia bacterium]
MQSTKTSPTIYWSQLAHSEWRLYVAATDKGLCFVGGNNQPFDEAAAWGKSYCKASAWIRDDKKLQPYVTELIEYFQGKRDRFTLPVDRRGTAFQQAVWDALGTIPYGETRSYSEIADLIQKPSAVRAVGTAIGANPVLIGIPCHRVIGKNGTLTGYRGGLEMKTKLLQLEKTHSRDGGNMLHDEAACGTYC